MEWDEEIEIPYGSDANEEIQNLIERYNNEELARKEINPDYPVDIRKIVKIYSITNGESKKEKLCEWRKVNSVTIHDKTGFYDLKECIDCGLQIKQYQLQTPTRKCYPERTCADHQKIYATKEKFQQHIKRSHNKLKVTKSLPKEITQ